MRNFRKFLLPALVALVIIMLLINPTKYAECALNGAIVWATILLPTLFPFMFFSKLFTTFEVTSKLSKPFNKLSRFLFNCSGDCIYIFLLSILCGYPTGAKLISDQYCEGKISRGEAIRSVSFCSTSGPMFIIGSVGCGMFLSNASGIIILCAHIAASIINGIIYRKRQINETSYSPSTFSNNKTVTTSDIVFSSINAILVVGAYIIIFFILSEIFIDLGIFTPASYLLSKIGIPTDVTNGILCGLLEMTKGCSIISKTTLPLKVMTPLACLLITFGGFSTFMQSLAFLEKFDMPKSLFLVQKITQSLIATALCFALSYIFL